MLTIHLCLLPSKQLWCYFISYMHECNKQTPPPLLFYWAIQIHWCHQELHHPTWIQSLGRLSVQPLVALLFLTFIFWLFLSQWSIVHCRKFDCPCLPPPALMIPPALVNSGPRNCSSIKTYMTNCITKKLFQIKMKWLFFFFFIFNPVWKCFLLQLRKNYSKRFQEEHFLIHVILSFS